MRLSLAWILLTAAVPAWAGEGRGLPRGEDQPLFVDEIWRSPQGEVQLLSGRDGKRSAYLRLESGELAELESLEGTASCQEWFLAHKRTSKPQELCSLVFRGGNSPIRVSAGSLVKGSIFSGTSSAIRGRRESL